MSYVPKPSVLADVRGPWRCSVVPLLVAVTASLVIAACSDRRGRIRVTVDGGAFSFAHDGAALADAAMRDGAIFDGAGGDGSQCVDDDGDGVCNEADRCHGADDRDDVDGDTVPDDCDCSPETSGCARDSRCAESADGVTCTCLSGYTGDGVTCAPVDCGPLSAPTNGVITIGGTTYRQTVTYLCDPGYGIRGPLMRICEATGAWSGSDPTCAGALTCACGGRFGAGDRVRSIIDEPSGATDLGPMSEGIVLAARIGTAGDTVILVEWDAWSLGHHGQCGSASCGDCAASGTRRWWVGCDDIESF